MKASTIIKTLDVLGNAQRPAMIWGPPGVGKSNVVKQYAEKKFTAAPAGRKRAVQETPCFIDLRLPLLDAVDLRGIPANVDGRTKWLPPEFLPRDGRGVIFIDELPQGAQVVQNAASQLILDRKLGEYTLPAGWEIIAAGNRTEDRAATNKMPSHIANRFVHINFDFDATEWLNWAVDNELHPMVIGFGAFKPALLHNFNPKERVNPTPRTWHFLSDILKEDGIDDLEEIVQGTVGQAAAVEFNGFVRVFRELPDYEAIVKKPATTKVPENVATRYAVSAMLSQRAEKEHMPAITTYVDRMEKEFQVLTMNEMTRRNKHLAETSAYIKWATQNADVLINASVR